MLSMWVAEGSSNAWTAPFNGNTSYLVVPGNSQLAITSVGSAGYTVGPAANHKLKLANASSPVRWFTTSWLRS